MQRERERGEKMMFFSVFCGARGLGVGDEVVVCGGG